MFLVSTLRKRFSWYVPSMNYVERKFAKKKWTNPYRSRDKYSRNFSSSAFCERYNKAHNKMVVILIRFSVWLQVIFIAILFFPFFLSTHSCCNVLFFWFYASYIIRIGGSGLCFGWFSSNSKDRYVDAVSLIFRRNVFRGDVWGIENVDIVWIASAYLFFRSCAHRQGATCFYRINRTLWLYPSSKYKLKSQITNDNFLAWIEMRWMDFWLENVHSL